MEWTLDGFTRAYLVTALWSSADDNDKPLDDRFSASDFGPYYVGLARRDCDLFRASAAYAAYVAWVGDRGPSTREKINDDETIAHDFWLTRNGHGAGFWDGDYPEPHATALTDLSKIFGETSLYVDDEGKVCLER